MKISVEFNPLDPNDVRALQHLLTGAQNVQVAPVAAPQAVAHAPAPPVPVHHAQPTAAAEPMREVRREMTDVANDLGKKIGAPQKMSTHDRAKLAAQTRWAKQRGQTPPATAASHSPQKKSPNDDDDRFNGAEEHRLDQYPVTAGEEIRNERARTPASPRVPDGREMLEESYDKDGEGEEQMDMMSDPDLREIRERAASYG